VRVSFRAAAYTASEYPCGTLALIARGGSAQLPLLADFSPEILRFTDKGRILGEAVIRYRFLEQEREAARSVILATHNRNTVTEGDTAALAAFISPTNLETADYVKYITGLGRNGRRTGHNQNFQYAIWLLEGLRAGGIILGNTFAAASEVQFPAETLAFRIGSARDFAILFAACPESVGIPAAFVQTEGDFLAAVSLNISQSAAETLFNGTGKILIINNQAWLPLSMSAFNKGFTSAWNKGIAVLDETFETGKTADFVMVEEAWTNYPPAPLPEQGGSAARTDTVATAREANRAEVPVTALFNEVLINLTENTNAAGTIQIQYRSLGAKKESKTTVQMPLFHRNAFSWEDDRRAAAMFEALRLYGISYVVVPATSYKNLSANEAALDNVSTPTRSCPTAAATVPIFQYYSIRYSKR